MGTSVKPVSRSVTPAGNSSASSTESSQTVRCHLTRPLEVVMMLSTPSSLRPVLASTSQEPSSLISSQLLSMRSEPEPTDSFSTQSSLSLVRRMPPTTSPVVTTPSERKSLISASTESESSLISALVSRVSLSSTPSEVVPDPVSDLSSSRDSLLITERSPSSDSPSTHPHRSPPPLLNHTTPSSPPTLSLSPPMSLSSRPTWCHTHVSTLCFPPTPQLSPLRRHTTSSSLSLKSPTPPSSQPP